MVDGIDDDDLKTDEINAILSEIKDKIPPPWGKTIACDQGWHKLVAKCHLELNKIDPNYEVCQVKEKFGTLRYYFWTKKDDEIELQMWKTSQKYELLSAETCEITGKPGKLMFKDGLYKTLAEEYEKDGWEQVKTISTDKIFGI